MPPFFSGTLFFASNDPIRITFPPSVSFFLSFISIEFVLQETYTFTVGYHELMGSKIPLKKPLLVLKKMKRDSDAENSGTESSSRVELEVIGIIRQRILFKTRPKALISSKIQFCFFFPPLLPNFMCLPYQNIDNIQFCELG